MPRSIAHQIACVRHVVAAYRDDEDVRAGAEEAIATLEWLKAHRDAVLTVYRLQNDSAVKMLMDAFPDATFDSIPSRSQVFIASK